MAASTLPKKAVGESLAKAMKAMAGGKNDIAVFWLKKWAQLDPRNHAELRQAAVQTVAIRDWQTAANYLKALSELDTAPQTLLDLARAYARSGQHAEAAKVCRALDKSPAAAPLHAQVCLIYAEIGEVDQALLYFTTAKRSGALDPGYALMLSDALWETDPQAAVAPIETAFAALLQSPDAPADMWAMAFRLMEFLERRRRGMLLYHVPEAAEVDFSFVRAAAAQIHERTKILPLGESAEQDHRIWIIAMAAGDLVTAGAALRSVAHANPQGVHAAFHLESTFLASAEDWDIPAFRAALPRVHDLAVAKTQSPHVLFLPCDCAYMRSFGLPLLRSIANTNPEAHVHIHLFAADIGEAAEIRMSAERVTPLHMRITVEYCGESKYFNAQSDKRAYYHTARFLRFHEFLENAPGTMWMMDVDALMNGDFNRAVSALGECDVGLRGRPARIEPWNRFSACLVAARPTDAAKHYFRLVSCYLARIMECGELRWGADQMALYAAYLALKTANALPVFAWWLPDIADVMTDPHSAIWFTGSAAKFAHLSNKGVPTSPYEKLFRKYV